MKAKNPIIKIIDGVGSSGSKLSAEIPYSIIASP